ncbi:hypothetical protein GCM10009677_27860 [Sphaerisporangium rubeum]|uniref:DUF4352 domain-containing protein n=1 Tax=Sphaerisporangium rubeum TaxID=321317 RepID=A0A7X0M4W2_9ACTN|nr:hypothetical protein [Sphaerisporangium rubeum]MBB6471695.1 hypothetical protein [Sphaerisporangium rubeum]
MRRNRDQDDTGVFQPPAGEPSWFTPGPRLPRPDTRVWPPPDSRSSSTLPIPKVQDTPSGPAWSPPADVPQMPPPLWPPPPQQASEPARPAAEDRPAGRRKRRPMPPVARFGLRLFGAVGLSAALLAVQAYDALHRYESRVPRTEVRYVAHGMTASLENAEWKLIGFSQFPEQSPDTPDRLVIQIDLEATALNEEGRFYTTTPPGAVVTDTRGRSWLAQVWKAPEELLQGIPGRFTLVAAVPKELAGQVELELWQNERQALGRTGKALHFDR